MGRLNHRQLDALRNKTLGSRDTTLYPSSPTKRGKPGKSSVAGQILVVDNGRTLTRNHLFPSTRLRTRKQPNPDASEDPFRADIFDYNDRLASAPRGPSKRARQFENWNKLIPNLVPLFLKVLHKTQSLRDTTGFHLRDSPPCDCQQRVLKIAVIRMLAIEQIAIRICSCPARSAPAILLRAGLFPCSPCHPTLAVDIQVLDFVRELFLSMPPNNTALCSTLERFLAKRGYELATKDTLRVRFGNALQWYTVLVHATDARINSLLAPARALARGPEIVISEQSDSPTSPVPPSSPPPLASSPSTPAPPPVAVGSKRARMVSPETSDEEDGPAPPPANPFPDPADRTRPSDYLISACACCFGGLKHDPSQTFDVSVCADGCFTQKRQHGDGTIDPAKEYPNTIFIPDEMVTKMANYVEGVRAPKTRRKRSRVDEEEEEDGYDGALRVPRSALAGCAGSFKAADENREKASTRFFADTGLMALVCRHDHVIFLVNMRTPGEKQYYVLALLEMFFQHLPKDITAGVLYDIGCLTEKSCINFEFLGRYLQRIAWAVSVFHAFGHNWACQLIYHPLKRKGFGFTNGEGCERFWFSISKLIPNLRIAGYHHRLYTLDMQVAHDTKTNKARLGMWLLRRTRHCEQKLREANAELERCNVSDEDLRRHWAEQVRIQTKPQQRRSQKSGQIAIQDIIACDKTIDMLRARVHRLEEGMLGERSSLQRVYAENNLRDSRTALSKWIAKRTRLEQKLGSDDRASFKALKFRPYFTAKINAFNLKKRIRTKIIEHKMEYDPVERSARRTSSDRKKNEHVSSMIKKREPGIQKLIQQYNAECKMIEDLVERRQSPRDVLVPQQLEKKGIFKLDVDDVIWSDVGLDNNNEPQPWLTDPNIRDGIRALLQKDRCVEEAHRLLRERAHLQIWFAAEWQAVDTVLQESPEGSVKYQFELQRNDLLQLFVTWKKSLDSLDFDDKDLPRWGPSREQVLRGRVADFTPSWTVIGQVADVEESEQSEDDGGDGSENDDEEVEDAATIAMVSTLERHGQRSEEHNEELIDDWE